MLVLTRKRDEFIKIGSDVVIRVMKTGKGTVKLGIEAPASVRVLRGEVAEADASERAEIGATYEEDAEVEVDFFEMLAVQS